MKLVVDASVAIKWLINEPASEFADRLLDGAHAWRRCRLGEIVDAQYDDIVVRIANGLIACQPLRPLAPRAAAIARELDHPVYDCFYLALAEAEEAPLITADRRLLSVVRDTALAQRALRLGSLTDRSSRRR